MSTSIILLHNSFTYFWLPKHIPWLPKKGKGWIWTQENRPIATRSHSIFPKSRLHMYQWNCNHKNQRDTSDSYQRCKLLKPRHITDTGMNQNSIIWNYLCCIITSNQKPQHLNLTYIAVTFCITSITFRLISRPAYTVWYIIEWLVWHQWQYYSHKSNLIIIKIALSSSIIKHQAFTLSRWF